MSWDREYHQDLEDMPKDDGTVQQETREFSVKETNVGQTVSPSNNDSCEMNVNINKNHLLNKSAYYSVECII